MFAACWNCWPGVLRVAQDLEDDAGMQRLPGMDGCGQFGHVTHSLDLSVNLSNASHYDVNDACQGFSIWTEDKPGTTGNWYFVLPNLRGTVPDSDREYIGIAIALSHGVLVSWDGRLIRHCTLVKTRQAGNVFGTFFAAKTRVVKFGMRVARERYHAAADATSRVVSDAQQAQAEDSSKPVEGKLAVEMSGDEDGIVDNNGGAMGVRGVQVVDVDEGSIVDISEDEVENSEDDDETIDDGISVPADDRVFSGSRNVDVPKLLSCFISGSDRNMDTVPDPSSGAPVATTAGVASAPTEILSSLRVPRKSVGMIPSRAGTADWRGGRGHFSRGGHSQGGGRSQEGGGRYRRFGRNQYRGGGRWTWGGGGEGCQGMRHHQGQGPRLARGYYQGGGYHGRYGRGDVRVDRCHTGRDDNSGADLRGRWRR